MIHTGILILLASVISAGLMYFFVHRKYHRRQTSAQRLQSMSTLQQAILNDASYAIISTDVHGIITLFNPAAERMLGYRAHELVGKETPAIFHDTHEVVTRAQAFSAELQETIAPGFDVFVVKSRQGLPNQHEWTYIRKDGTRLSVMLAVSALRNHKNPIEGYLGIASDMSKQIETQKELRSARDQLSKAAEVAQLGIWTWTPADQTLIWNDRMYEMYQQPLELRDKGLNYGNTPRHPERSEGSPCSGRISNITIGINHPTQDSMH